MGSRPACTLFIFLFLSFSRESCVDIIAVIIGWPILQTAAITANMTCSLLAIIQCIKHYIKNIYISHYFLTLNFLIYHEKLDTRYTILLQQFYYRPNSVNINYNINNTLYTIHYICIRLICFN